jgi:hypothetical protein
MAVQNVAVVGPRCWAAAEEGRGSYELVLGWRGLLRLEWVFNRVTGCVQEPCVVTNVQRYIAARDGPLHQRQQLLSGHRVKRLIGFRENVEAVPNQPPRSPAPREWDGS